MNGNKQALFGPDMDRENRENREKRFLFGVSIGVDRNTTALAVMERLAGARSIYIVKKLERMAENSSPEMVADRAFAIRMSDDLRDHKVDLFVDISAAGAAALRPMKSLKQSPFGFFITSGTKIARDRREVTLPRRDVVTTGKMLLEGGRLQIAQELEDAVLLRDALLGCPTEVEAGADAWRAGRNEDYVMAVLIPVWYAENYITGSPNRRPRGPMKFGRIPGEW